MKRHSNCRFCAKELREIFVDLGMSPLSNAYVRQENLKTMAPFYPLQVYVCDNCFLVQLEEFERPEQIFSEYAYFSSFSDTWLKHVEAYVNQMIARLNLNEDSKVVEIGSNDGYLLQYFRFHRIPVLGVEPATNVAKVAEKKGIPTIVKFFGQQTAKELYEAGHTADLLLGNNVLAHVPDLNDFVAGLRILLEPAGVITMEFPHLLRLMEENQFDTIYHEHFSYFSFLTVEEIFSHHNLTLFDVEELPTHGGSLRIYASHQEDKTKALSRRVNELKSLEEAAGLNGLKAYSSFKERVKAAKRSILEFLIKAKQEGKTIVGYGAPAKGNTLLNYCGIRSDFIDFTVDRNPYKQGMYLPGTLIPVKSPEAIRAVKPDYIFILPWNIKDEVMGQMAFIRDWGGKFVVPIPQIRVYP